MAQKILVDTDKNGTKYYHCTDRCFKCGGTGMIDYYRPVNGGVCFDCDGSGIVEWDEKEYTPEYAAKLEERRIKRQQKADAKRKAEWFSKNGFAEDGTTYVFLGNTYERKEDIKAAGGRWCNEIGWHIPEPAEGFQYLKITVDEVAEEIPWGWDYKWEKLKDLKKRCKEEYNRLNNIHCRKWRLHQRQSFCPTIHGGLNGMFFSHHKYTKHF